MTLKCGKNRITKVLNTAGVGTGWEKSKCRARTNRLMDLKFQLLTLHSWNILIPPDHCRADNAENIAYGVLFSLHGEKKYYGLLDIIKQSLYNIHDSEPREQYIDICSQNHNSS